MPLRSRSGCGRIPGFSEGGIHHEHFSHSVACGDQPAKVMTSAKTRMDEVRLSLARRSLARQNRDFARTTRSAARLLTKEFSGPPRRGAREKESVQVTPPNLIFLSVPAVILYVVDPTRLLHRARVRCRHRGNRSLDFIEALRRSSTMGAVAGNSSPRIGGSLS